METDPPPSKTPTQADLKYGSPLHLAAYQGNAELVRNLLQNGADPIGTSNINLKFL